MGNPLVRFWEDQEYDWYMEEILWHRRESRRQTEKTNIFLSSGSLLSTHKIRPTPTRQSSTLLLCFDFIRKRRFCANVFNGRRDLFRAQLTVPADNQDFSIDKLNAISYCKV